MHVEQKTLKSDKYLFLDPDQKQEQPHPSEQLKMRDIYQHIIIYYYCYNTYILLLFVG